METAAGSAAGSEAGSEENSEEGSAAMTVGGLAVEKVANLAGDSGVALAAVIAAEKVVDLAEVMEAV